MSHRPLVRLALLIIVAATAACSGGGGNAALPAPNGAGVTATPAAAGAPSAPAPVATVAPTPAPTATPAAQYAGSVVDLPYDGVAGSAVAPGYSVLASGAAAPTGAPVAGAAVYVGPYVLAGPTAPPAPPTGFATATTLADGSFRVSGVAPGRAVVTVYAPGAHAAILHADATVDPAHPSLGAFAMTAPTASESAWLARENADRAAYGAPAVGFDEAALEAARYWASAIAVHGYPYHCVPAAACQSDGPAAAPAWAGPQDADPVHRFRFEHGFSGADEGENLAAAFANWQAVDASFMAEASQCPAVAACAFTDATGHFLNIVDAQYVWTGAAAVTDAAGVGWYDQEFTLVASYVPQAGAALASRRSAALLRR